MKAEKLVSHTIKDSEGKEIPKKFHDYTAEEIDHLWGEDPDMVEKLWGEAEEAAINDPDNHNKST